MDPKCIGEANMYQIIQTTMTDLGRNMREGMNIEYTKHISGHSLKHYTNLSVLRYDINSSMAAIDTIKKHLSDLGYGNQLKDRKEKFLIEVIAEKDRIQTFNDIVKRK